MRLEASLIARGKDSGSGSSGKAGVTRCHTEVVPTSHPRHAITETPALATVLEPLRARLGPDTPTLAELVRRGAETIVDRLRAASLPDPEEVRRIRHTTRQP